jgi:RNA polymerase sigma-70 factor (ECF subfamily)
VDENEEAAGLLTEARNGNQQALGNLLALLRPWLRGQAQGLLRQRPPRGADFSDIVQEVHLRVFQRFPQFRGDSVPQLRAWVRMILRNMVVDGYRGRNVHEEDGGSRFPDLPGDATTPSEVVHRGEQQARLYEALDRLPERQRLVFELRFYEGLSFEEVAQSMGVKVGNARVLMVRATEKLRKELGDDRD